MAYTDYLIKVGTKKIPNKYIAIESFKVTKHTQDIDSYRDATGVLHRNVLSHRVMKAEFTTPTMYASDVNDLMTLINGQYSDSTTKTATVSFYDAESNGYVSMPSYVPDIEFSIRENSPRGFIYNPVRIAFIGY